MGIVKKPQKTREIADALLAGGLITTSKKPIAPIYNTLLQMKNRGDLERLQDGGWGLSEWYGGRRKKPVEKPVEPEVNSDAD